MGFFGSGDKIQTSADNRIGASDAAQIASGMGFIFNGANATPASIVNTTKVNVWLIVGVVAAIGAFFWLINGRGK